MSNRSKVAASQVVDALTRSMDSMVRIAEKASTTTAKIEAAKEVAELAGKAHELGLIDRDH